MKKKKYLFLVLCCALFLGAQTQNAPITYVQSLTNASPGTYIIPVTVDDFMNIGAVSLTLDYDPAVLQFVSATTNAAFTDFGVNGSNPGRIVFGWFGAGVTLPNGAHLADITFNYLGGTTNLTWYDDGGSCEYADGAYTVLNDIPYATYYQNATITSHVAPETSAPVFTNAVPGPLVIPVTVKGFTDIGAMTLTLEYDPDVLVYDSYSLNLAIDPTYFAINSVPAPNGKAWIMIDWFGDATSLPDDSHLVDLNFEFTLASGKNFSELIWIDNGGSCEYTDEEYNILIDTPTEDYYHNGLVTCQLAPVTYLPVITNAAPGAIDVPVTVDNFTDIAAITLTFEYDPTVLTYTGFDKNPALVGIMDVGSQPSSGGKYKISIDWFGDPVTLGNGSEIVAIQFTYISGTSALPWLDYGGSCEYADANFNILYDLPTADHYIDGLVSSHLAPVTIADSMMAAPGNPISVPVTVRQFLNIGALSLTLDYDPGVLEYIDATPNPAIAADFAANMLSTGRLAMDWFGPGQTFPDETVLLTLNFNYLGGTSALAWYDNGGSCEYADGTPALNVLYDIPQATYYINGLVEPALIEVDFEADDTLPDINATVTFTDLSEGGPTQWTWSISPLTYIFVGGTGEHSQHPQVQFTAAGPYTITLQASNAYRAGSLVKIDYIWAGIPGLWVGDISTEWNFGQNWHNKRVPTQPIDVTIPAVALFWPIFPGDLTLGSQCKSVTMYGSSFLDVTGDLTIEPGHFLKMDGAGELRVGEDWINEGLFSPGTGIVRFNGAQPSTIVGVTNPISHIRNYQFSSSPASLTFLSGAQAGPTGDNEHADVSLGFLFNYMGVAYDHARINTNGWLSLNLSGDDLTSGDNEMLFSILSPNTTLAPWWDDLLADGVSSISYKTEGVSPDQVFTAEWKSILAYREGATARLNFQVKLFESSNSIEFCYGIVESGTHHPDEGASAGIEDLIGGTDHFFEATTQSYSDPVLNLKSETQWPSVNYRFTPPPVIETFYNIIGSKSNQTLTIEKDIKMIGTF